MTVNSAVEQRHQTRNMLDWWGRDIVLMRQGPDTRTPTGGTQPGGVTPLPVQSFYFSAVVEDGRHVTRRQGEQTVYEYVLIGMPDADIQEDDTFKLDGQLYEVNHVNPVLNYQKKARVYHYAS